ncbi:hypothetical protein U1Q18_046908 [Sarracenia purpurea var. burkii]
MPKDRKVFVKPRSLTEKRTTYEKQRQKTIERNAAKLDSLGLKNIARSLFGSNQIAQSANSKKGRFNIDCSDDDDEYQPHDREEGISSSTDHEQSPHTNKILCTRKTGVLLPLLSSRFQPPL